MRCAICVNGGENAISNIGYGNGYSVLQVIDAVRKVSGATSR